MAHMSYLDIISCWLRQMGDALKHSNTNAMSSGNHKLLNYFVSGEHLNSIWHTCREKRIIYIRCILRFTEVYCIFYSRTHIETDVQKHILYIYHYHHRVVPLARISLTLSRHFSLSFIASGRSSGLEKEREREREREILVKWYVRIYLYMWIHANLSEFLHKS